MKALLIIVGLLLFTWFAIEVIGALAAAPAWAWAMYLLFSMSRRPQTVIVKEHL